MGVKAVDSVKMICDLFCSSLPSIRSIAVMHLLREAQDIPELDGCSVVQDRLAAHAAKDLVLV